MYIFCRHEVSSRETFKLRLETLSEIVKSVSLPETNPKKCDTARCCLISWECIYIKTLLESEIVDLPPLPMYVCISIPIIMHVHTYIYKTKFTGYIANCIFLIKCGCIVFSSSYFKWTLCKNLKEKPKWKWKHLPEEENFIKQSGSWS